MTHEEFLAAVRGLVVARVADGEQRARVLATKLIYGAGQRHTRGTCYYERWEQTGRQALVEVSAFGESSALQLAGTTIHELAHVVAGRAVGHQAAWKAAARELGLIHPRAAGQKYVEEDFAPDIRQQILELPAPDDGAPVPPSATLSAMAIALRACQAGAGTLGGRSRGPGSGSRLRLWTCECARPIKVRVARDAFRVRCLECGCMFKRTVRRGR